MMKSIYIIIALCLLFKLTDLYSNDSIQSLISNCKTDTQKIIIYINAAKQFEFENPSLSNKYIQQALKLSKNINNVLKEADSYIFMGLLKEDIAEYEDAKRYFNLALELFKKVNSKKGIGTVFNNLGSMYEYIGEHDTAVTYFQKSIKINDECGNIISAADARYNIGLIHYTNGNYELALTNWYSVMKVYEELEDFEGLSSCQHCIGMTLRKQNKNEKAIEFLKKAKTNGIKSGDDRLVGNIIMSIGNVYLENDDLDIAMKYFKDAAVIYNKTGDIHGIASIETNIGDYHKINGRVDSAIIYYTNSYNKFVQLNVKQGETHTLTELAECFKMKEEYGKALQYCDNALVIAKQIDSKDYQSMIYQLIYSIYNNKGNFKKALEYYIKYSEMNDSIFTDSKQKIIEELQTKYETEKKEQQIILQQADIEKKTAIINKERIQKYAFIAIGLLLLILAIVVIRNLRINRKANALLTIQNEQIKQQKEEIESQRDLAANQRDLIAEQKQDITDSIQYAFKIQSAIFPTAEEIKIILKEFFILYKPRDIVSGDFYWINKQDKKIIIIAADCTGHGVPGAFMSMLGVAFLNEIVNKENISSPADILNRLREDVILALKQHGNEGEQTDGMDVAAITIDVENNIMEFSGANNPLYFIRNNELIEMKGDKMPVSIYAKMRPFTNFKQNVNKGDTIYIFSDGFADQFGGPNGKKFKYKNFKELLLENCIKPMTEQKQILDKTFENWRGNYEQIDDVLVMGIKI